MTKLYILLHFLLYIAQKALFKWVFLHITLQSAKSIKWRFSGPINYNILDSSSVISEIILESGPLNLLCAIFGKSWEIMENKFIILEEVVNRYDALMLHFWCASDTTNMFQWIYTHHTDFFVCIALLSKIRHRFLEIDKMPIILRIWSFNLQKFYVGCILI